jgi:multidrug resistance efflux pump
MPNFLGSFFNPKRTRYEQAVHELKRHLSSLHQDQIIMSDSLAKLQAAAAAQAASIAAAQTYVNTLEAAVPTEGASDADLDAVTTTLEANNAALAALVPAATPVASPAPAPVVAAPSPSPSTTDTTTTTTSTDGTVANGTVDGVNS